MQPIQPIQPIQLIQPINSIKFGTPTVGLTSIVLYCIFSNKRVSKSQFTIICLLGPPPLPHSDI